MGTTGEYSDREEWPVAAYKEDADAQIHVIKATTEARKYEKIRGNRYGVKGRPNIYDPDLTMDYTGTSYFIYNVEIFKNTEQFKKIRQQKKCDGDLAYKQW